jgi:hypothetical protein
MIESIVPKLSGNQTPLEEVVVDRSAWPVWIGRVGDSEPKADYSALTPAERLALCWEATRQAWAAKGEQVNESAFRRDVESISRRGR